MKGKRVLVTGAAGFIGKHLAQRLLKEKYKVIAVDKRNFKPIPATSSNSFTAIKLDLLRPSQQLKQAVNSSDIIFHLAAHSSAHMSKEFIHGYRNNVDSLLNILDSASRSRGTKRVIFPSSSTVYVGTRFPWRENTVLKTPVNWYAASKVTSELLCNYYSKNANIETVALRIFCGYGPGEEHKKIYASPISLFIWSMVAGRRPEVWGDGRQERDFIFIADIIEALLLAAEQPVSNRVFNVGSGVSRSFLDVIRIINDLLGKDIVPRFTEPRVSYYIDKTLADVTLANQVLGFKAQTTLEEGIRQTCMPNGF